MSELAAAVRGARVAAALTQAELARRAGINPSYVSRIESAAWERGGPWPSDDVLRSVARVLGYSSTELIRLKAEARYASGVEAVEGGWARCIGRAKYVVSMGSDDVHRAAEALLERNPPRGSVRVTSQLFELPRSHRAEVEYSRALARRLADDTAAVLYRMCVVGPTNLELVKSSTELLAGGRDPRTVKNIRTRFCFAPPAMVDVVVGEHEALIAVPDRRGHPLLRACLVVDDPDFVGALKDWYDDFIWEPPGEYVDVRYDRLDETLDQVRERFSLSA